ncbi:MAG TPA: phage baseplate assembly protein V [Nitrospira sp.]|nr:phage baseplate assembly protein V [Nitrospira sp.]
MVGLVKSVEDPQNLGRVQVNFPWLSDDNSSQWARVATLMAGSKRGSWFMPEVDDEVVVSFEHGDVQHPYIIGFVWNGRGKPPNDGIDTKVRRLRTVSGHVVEFDDRPGQERILIKSKAGHQIEMNDVPGRIHIETNGGQKVDMDDTPPMISIQTTAGNSIQIGDAPPGVTISILTGTLTVRCLQANVTAASLLNVTAPMTVFSGVVQTPTLIAQAVVGSAYTPAPGNTFGL